jgi:acyl-homoserine lactone acylase PvdQ
VPRFAGVWSAGGGPRSGYAAGYNEYLASVGGTKGVPDKTCRGQAWVRPITALDAYLLVYQLVDIEGLTSEPDQLANAQPPTATAQPSATADLSALAASVVRRAPGTDGLPAASQLRKLGDQATAGTGSNAIAIGSDGTRDHQQGMLLGNPHLPWQGALHLYQAQFTIPGTMNVEGATIVGVPLVVVGFTGSMAWSETTSRSWTVVPYQLTLVPGHPTEYVYDGKATDMTGQTVTVPELTAGGTISEIKHTVWYTRYGAVLSGYQGVPLGWSTTTAFALDDADAGNFRFLNQFLGIDEAPSVTQVLSVLKECEGGPWNNTVASDSAGRALYADIQYGATLVKSQVVAMCRSSRGALLFSFFWDNALSDWADVWSHPFQATDPLGTPYGLNTASSWVQQSFGSALEQMNASGFPYDLALGQVQYVTLDGQNIPLPGGPADPNGELNAMNINSPGAIPGTSSTYIQVVTWAAGDACPEAATVLAYSESDNPASPHYDDQTKLFSRRQWATGYFCPAQVAAHAVSTTVVSGDR